MKSMQRQIVGAKAVCLLIASIASISAQAATIGITYNFAGTLTAPPVFIGSTVVLDALATGSILSDSSTLNAIWNPATFHDHSVVDLTTGLLNGIFSVTAANGDTLSGNLFEDVSATTNGVGPFTQKLTFTGGTGQFAGATGSALGAGIGTPTGSTTSGSGTLTAPAIAPEPASVALIFGGLLVMVARRKLVRRSPARRLQ